MQGKRMVGIVETAFFFYHRASNREGDVDTNEEIC